MSRVQLGDLQINYLEDGSRSAPPLVLVHGFAGHAHTWDVTIAAVRDRYHVYALDLRGHGDSDHASEYGTRVLADDLGRFVDALELDRVTLAGASLGGITSYCYAAKHPDRVERLIVVDIGPEVDPAGVKRIMAAAGAPDTFDSLDDAIASQREIFPDAQEPALRSRTEHGVRATDDGRLVLKFDPGLRDFSKPQRNFDPDEQWARWRSLQCPTLLVRAERSDLLSTTIAQRMLDEQPHAELVTIPDSGHTIGVDAPDALATTISAWLD